VHLALGPPSAWLSASLIAWLTCIYTSCAAEEEARLLVAVTKPKITAVGDGFATVTFNSGPNLFSNDYTVSCYTRNLDTPTTSCSAVSTLDPAGSVDGKTPKVYGKLTANVTGLPGDEVYDCFINVYGPGGYDKCKYVGSTDIDCFEPGAPTIDGITPVIELSEDEWIPSLFVAWSEGSAPNPEPSATDDTFGVFCLPTVAGVTCPVKATLDIEYGEAGVTQEVDTSYATTPTALLPNTAYTCYALAEDTCAVTTTADAICSDGVEVISYYAPPGWDLTATVDGALVTDLDFTNDPPNGDALAINTYVGCYICTDQVTPCDEASDPSQVTDASLITAGTSTGWFLTSNGASFDDIIGTDGSYFCYGLTGTECGGDISCDADGVCTGCNQMVLSGNEELVLNAAG
jgi:hypothetical protein